MNGSGTAIAVGSSGYDGGSAGVGRVRVFDLVLEDWAQRGADIRGEFAADRSGSSVVISNDGLVIGVGEPYSEAGNTGQFERDFGQVRVFEWKSGEWFQRGEAITGVDKCDFASSSGGLAMDASGSTIVIGASEHDYNGLEGRNQGHARVFDWDGTNWVQRGSDMYGEAPGDLFGHTVALSASGNTVAVGALFNDVDAEDGVFGCVICRGSVRIFDWNASSSEWLQRGNDVDGDQDYDYSGSSLALNAEGDVVVIGSPQTNAPVGHPKRGAVTVYEWNESSWQKRGTRIEGEADGDISGSTVAVSMSGDTIAIGADMNDGSTDTKGHVRVFDWDGGSWLQRGDDIDGENTYDRSGGSLAMSNDGNKVASGARFTNDGAGYFAGHVRVFGWPESVTECVDSPLNFSARGGNIGCSDVANNPGRFCEVARFNPKSHCPMTCSTCPEYKCEDSRARFRLGPNEFRCGQITEENIEKACREDDVKKTCRETCNYCDA